MARKSDAERGREGEIESEDRARRAIPIVGVMGSGAQEHREYAEPLGRWLAREGFHLLTGGGAGVMESVSRAFATVPRRRGLVIGVLPGTVDEEGYRAPPGYPNRWVELPIRTHLPSRGTAGGSASSRNAINVLSAAVIVALPGGAGTRSELLLARRRGVPAIALGPYDRRPGSLPSDIPFTGDVRRATAFVRESCEGGRGGTAAGPPPRA